MAGIHDGHRDRLRETFMKTGLDDFHPHNVLELLLFYSIPRKDTNEIAHALIEEFGSIERVFDADVEELVKVKGITKNSAVLISMIPQLARYYMTRKADHGKPLKTIEELGSYLVPKFIGENHEILYLVFLDSKLQVLTCKKLVEGTTNSVEMRIDQIVKLAATVDAPRLAIAHNHPDGNPTPSPEDLALTAGLKEALKLINKELVDHVVVGDDQFMSIISLLDMDSF